MPCASRPLLALILLSLASVASPREIPGLSTETLERGAFTNTGDWAGSMHAARREVLATLDALDAERESLGLAGLEISPWHVLHDGFFPPEGVPPLEARFPPEIIAAQGGDPLNTPFEHPAGRPVRWEAAPEHWRWSDGKIINFSHMGVRPPGSATIFYRRIDAPEARDVQVWLGTDYSAGIWLNDREVFVNDLPDWRQCAPNQEQVTLPLRKGANHVVFKMENEERGTHFYFSFFPWPGDMRPDALSNLTRDRTLEFWAPEFSAFRFRSGAKDISHWFSRATTTTLERVAIADVADDLGASGAPFLRRLDALVAESAPRGDARWLELFEEAMEALRLDRMRDLPPLVFLRRTGYGRSGTNATMLGRRTGRDSEICIWDPANPKARFQSVFKTDNGFIFDMNLSDDAKRIVFSYMDFTNPEDSFHIWEIGVDGTGLRQITRGPWHDASPVTLPDGRIVFSSTRVESFSMCQDFLAAALYVVDPDDPGGEPVRIEYSTLCDLTPAVMPDGSILYTRWEYQDKNIFCTQGLWTVNPDGTRVQLFYGNTLTVPNSICQARPIPGTREVVATLAPHHFAPVGGIGIIDRDRGLEEVSALTLITSETETYQPMKGADWKNVNYHIGDRHTPWSYTDPYPLTRDRFLVSYAGHVPGPARRFWLCLLDRDGDWVTLFDDGLKSAFQPMPLTPRPVPHRLPAAPPKAEGEGEFYVADVYQGLLGKGVERGQVKQLRVMAQIPKKYNTEGPRYRDHYPAMGEATYYAKESYGVVPVDEDGSAHFKAPAGVELFFIALDADGKEVRRMGTVTQITAGEKQGCIGCHEPRFNAPPMPSAVMRRVAQGPDAITPEPWGAGPVHFTEIAQPVLDEHCASCHEGMNPAGGLDLSGDKNRFFNMAYSNLTRGGWTEFYHLHGAPTGNFPPMQTGSQVSRLTRLVEENHADLDLPDEARRRLYAWIDANVPYYGTWDMTRPYTPGGRDAWHAMPKPGVPEGRFEPEPWFAGFLEIFEDNCLPCHRYPDDTHLNLTRPEFSRVLNAHLGKEAGGMGLEGERAGRRSPVFATPEDPVRQALLDRIRSGAEALRARPRMDMPGAAPLPQQRDFGRLY